MRRGDARRQHLPRNAPSLDGECINRYRSQPPATLRHLPISFPATGGYTPRGKGQEEDEYHSGLIPGTAGSSSFREPAASAWTLPASHHVHRPRLRHRHRPVLRLCIRHSAGRPLRAACLRYWRRGSVHGDARNGRTRPGAPGLRSVLRIRYPLPRTLGWFCDRLDLRPGNGAGRHCGRHRLCRVHEVLVPEQPLLDLDCFGPADSARY